jgi:hypothetical protein
MSDSITEIRRRLQLATELPEMLDTSNRAATHWRDDTSSLLAEVERLQAAEAECRNSRGFVAAENERLRASLSEMLESFTEPEDDNDILRRARAALAPTKAS